MTGNAGIAAPLIVTLALDEAAQARFDRLRQAHFPPERNFLAAHLTLFHHLPPEREGEVVAEVAAECGQQRPLILTATGLLRFGQGVAYAFDAPVLVALRERLAAQWWPWLGAQDRQRFRPHITVQNKVPPERARALFEQLQATFSPFTVVGEGLLLWRYLGGPWQPAGRYPFHG
jgi:2'-5' RNA ligase